MKTFYLIILVIVTCVLVVLNNRKIDKFHYDTSILEEGGDSYDALAIPTCYNLDLRDVKNTTEYKKIDNGDAHVLIANGHTIITVDHTGTVKMTVSLVCTDNQYKQIVYEETELGRAHTVDGEAIYVRLYIEPIKSESKELVDIDRDNKIVEMRSANTLKAKQSGILECCNEYGAVIDSFTVEEGKEYVVSSDIKLVTIY